MLGKSSIVATLAVLAIAQVTAMPTFPARLPNGANVKGVAALGHVSPSGGGVLNDFGAAFDAAGRKWTTELCEADSDGDGQTNGQELGDPCCTWGTDAKLQWTTGVSHPGLATSKSDPTLWASVTCGSAAGGSNSTTAPTTSTAPATTTVAPTPTPASAASASSLAAASLAVATMIAVTLA